MLFQKQFVTSSYDFSFSTVSQCFLTGMSEEAIMELNLPTGIPILYELDKNLKPIKPMQFLGDEETVRKAMEAVAAQGKAKKQSIYIQLFKLYISTEFL